VDDQIWFVALDVARILGLNNTTMALRALAPDEKALNRIDTLGGPQRLNTISESGLYKLILRTDKPVARQFQDWVTRDVLPAIRKDGGYTIGQEKFATGEMTEEELVVRARMLLEAKRAGEALLAAKKLVKHGEFMGWVERHCTVGYPMAAKYMQVARHSKVVSPYNFEGGIEAFLDAHAKHREAPPEPAPSVPTFGAEEASYILKLQAMLIRGSDQEQLTAADKIDAFAARFGLTGEEAIEKSAKILPNQEVSADDAERTRGINKFPMRMDRWGKMAHLGHTTRNLPEIPAKPTRRVGPII
jgi:prophage antirepressor-like protein